MLDIYIISLLSLWIIDDIDQPMDCVSPVRYFVGEPQFQGSYNMCCSCVADVIVERGYFTI